MESKRKLSQVALAPVLALIPGAFGGFLADHIVETAYQGVPPDEIGATKWVAYVVLGGLFYIVSIALILRMFGEERVSPENALILQLQVTRDQLAAREVLQFEVAGVGPVSIPLSPEMNQGGQFRFPKQGHQPPVIATIQVIE